ncbi:helicase-related protein [Anaerobacillus isosaccharinicus]|uniref:Helicase C-terminal domain-containing protein n=1 Tax=Anaerobacillus isosaccharinicus TaxID=1532552 RepID=A0A1S2M8X5_9BACI|nr:helicase-related protein [Anaerobacillus isosaccharinicus]MBA5588885.1 hypothetical protein [Anaerobacillus isosaccharinicus]QOY37695.1 hypothetical protein AWH56_008980 [Anaerobacillus isosaccharinicus]
MSKKIRVMEDGKQFEAFLQIAMTVKEANNERRLVGVAFAGSPVATRAVHAALYTSSKVEIYDEATGKTEYLKTTLNYRRKEKVDGKVCHMFAIPRTSVNADYEESLVEARKNDKPPLPERIVMAKDGNIEEVVGLFLAKTYGLPKTASWSNLYMKIFSDAGKVEEIECEKTVACGKHYQNLKSARISAMKEEEADKIIDSAMKQGILQVKKQNIPLALQSVQAKFEQGMTAEQYIKKNAEIIANKFKTAVEVLYDGKTFFPYVGETARICVPAQAKAAMGMFHILKNKGAGFLVGDMGFGKTGTSLTTVYTKARQREDSGAKDGMNCLIIAPSNVVPKWASSEIPTVLGYDKTVTIKIYDLLKMVENKRPFKKGIKNICTIIEGTDDALAYCRLIKSGWTIPRGMIHFVLVSTDRMKLSAEKFVLGAKWNDNQKCWISPNSGLPLQSPPKKNKKTKEDEADVIAGWKDVVESPSLPPTTQEIALARKNGTLGTNGLPLGYVKTWSNDIRAFQDRYEKEGKKDCSLARPAQKKWGEVNKKHRWMIAQIFQRKLKNHFQVGIFDEIQHMKAMGSGRGSASHKLLKACQQSMFLTGTLTNGESSSIFAMLWRAFPRELKKFGFSHKTSTEAWASRYGVIEKTITLDDGDKNVGKTTNRRSEEVRVKEKPGIAPQLIANHLLDKCVFGDLTDLQIPLVKLEETPIIVSLDEDHKEEYKKLHNSLYRKAQELSKEVGTGAWAKFNPSTLNYADQPSLGINVEWFEYEDKAKLNPIDQVTAPAFPVDYYPAKERKLVNIVQTELGADRPCIIYTNFTGKNKTNERIQKVLADHGIDCEILNDKVKPDARFDWLNSRVEKGTKVIVCNMALVEVGLDLMNFPTLIYFQLCDEVSRLRQSSRRAFRLGQQKLCKVIYLVNSDTQQMVQFKRLMSRRIAAMITEGRIERSDDLAKYADLSAGNLTNDLSKMLSESDLVADWQKAASKDLDNLELVSETEFKQKLKDAFEKLTAETIRLSGYVPPVQNNELDDLFADFDISALDNLFAEFDEGALDNLFDTEKTTETETKKEKDKTNVVEFKPKKKPSEEAEKVVFKHVEQISLFEFAR